MVSNLSQLNRQDIYFAKLKSLPDFIITEGRYRSSTLGRPCFSESAIAKGGRGGGQIPSSL